MDMTFREQKYFGFSTKDSSHANFLDTKGAPTENSAPVRELEA
jgi:hypothetical protein